MPDAIEKGFVRSFVEFLKKQLEVRALNADAMESIEVAIQCLEAAFETNEDTARASVSSSTDNVGADQIDLFTTYESMYTAKNPQKEQAEEIKNEGNRLMKENKYFEALQLYNRAIAFDPKNPVLYCNRAAAFTRLGDHEKAVADCKLALAYNPDYGKAYGRMGVAYSNLNKFDLAKTAYQKAIELEPGNEDYANNLVVAEQRLATAESQSLGLLDNMILEALNTQPTGAMSGVLRNLMSDRTMSNALQRFAQNPDAVINATREFGDRIGLAPEMVSQIGEVLADVRYSGFIQQNRGNEGAGGGNNDTNPPPQPPPTS